MRLFLSLCISIFLSSICIGQNPILDRLKKPLPDLEKIGLDQAGLDQDSIQSMIEHLNQSSVYDLRSLIVIKDHKLVMEEYANTYWRETIHDIRSAGKSITALLMGIALDKGYVKSVEQSVYEFFPEITFTHPPTKEHLAINIKHLLMMSSGLDADANDIESQGNGLHWVAEENWLEIALNLPMKFTSGEKWVYNDVCAMLCGAIIQKASGIPLSKFAQEHLFEPLGIREFYWYKNPKGIPGAMGNLYISNLAFAKLGLLVLEKGNWQGKQIISSDWIAQLSTERFDISTLDPFADHYGYLWYIKTSKIKDKEYSYIYASGNGGNKLYVIPEEQLVISIQSSAYGRGYGHERSNFIFRSILGAILPK